MSSFIGRGRNTEVRHSCCDGIVNGVEISGRHRVYGASEIAWYIKTLLLHLKLWLMTVGVTLYSWLIAEADTPIIFSLP